MGEKVDRTAPAQDRTNLVWRYFREYLGLVGDRLSDGDTEISRVRHLDLTPECQLLADALRGALGWGKEPPGGIELPQRFHDLLFSPDVGGGARLLRLLEASEEAKESVDRKIERGVLTLSAAADLSNWGEACRIEVEALAVHLASGPRFKRFMTELLYVPGGRDFSWRIGGKADLIVRTFVNQDEGYSGREDALVLEGSVSVDTDDPHGEVVRVAEEILGIGLVADVFETSPFDARMLRRSSFVTMPDEADEAAESALGSLSGAARDATARLTLAEVRPKSDLEAQRIRRGKADDLLESRREVAGVILRAVDDRGLVLRRAGRLYLHAVAAREIGITISSAFTCLEGLLLDGGDSDKVTARLTEAVVYRLGGGSAAREQLRKEVKELYDLRSEYVHVGQVTKYKTLNIRSARERALALVGGALQREIAEWSG